MDPSKSSRDLFSTHLYSLVIVASLIFTQTVFKVEESFAVNKRRPGGNLPILAIPFIVEGTVDNNGVIIGKNHSDIYGIGVLGWVPASSGFTKGVYGRSDSSNGRGVMGYAHSSTGITYGVVGRSNSSSGRGVLGVNYRSTGITYGVIGRSYSVTNGAIGVLGTALGDTGATYGVYGLSKSPVGFGVYGRNTDGGEAGRFAGDVSITGDLDVGGSITGLATVITSGGAGDSGGIPALDGTGKLDSSFIPLAITTTLTGNVTGNVTGNADTATLATTATSLAGNGANCPAGQYPLGVDAGGSVEGCTVPGASDWGLTGNAGITTGTNFLGTTDNVALEVKVNSVRAFRIEPNATSPNIIGGYLGNTVTAGKFGATIGGGGSLGFVNSVTNHYGSVGGGLGNTASAQFSTVGGGVTSTASGLGPTVGGGVTSIASGLASTVPGGIDNTASGYIQLCGWSSGQSESSWFFRMG